MKDSKPFFFVVIAGAVGGLTSWLLQWLAGLTPFQKPAILGIPALVVVGAVAAVFGVYLIANSDIKELPHTLAFALVCGVFWQPVFDAAKLYVNHTVVAHQASIQETATQNLSVAIQSYDKAGLKSRLEEATNSTTQALSRVPSVQDGDLKDRMIVQTNQTVQAIGKASDTAPKEAIQNLQTIGEAAVKSGRQDVAKGVLMELGTLRSKNPALAVDANEAVDKIVRAQPKLEVQR